MEFIKQNAKPIAITAGVAVGLLGLYVAFKSSSKTKKSTKVTGKDKDAMISKIKVTYSGRILSVDTVADIFDAVSKLMASDTVVRSQEIQKLRRQNRNNLAQYIKVCEEAVQQNDILAAKIQNGILDRLGIPESIFGQSINFYLSQNHPKLTNASSQELQMRAEELGSQKVLSWEEFRPIFKRFTGLLEAELAGIDGIKKFMTDPISLGTIISFRVYDVLYDEFGFQDEEISAAIATYSQQAYVQEPQTFQRFIQASQTLQMIQMQGQ